MCSHSPMIPRIKTWPNKRSKNGGRLARYTVGAMTPNSAGECVKSQGCIVKLEMSFIEGVGRDQQTLFPEVLDDYIPADHPVRFIDAYVDQLNLGELGFARATASETGRPGYDPGDLLKLYIYG